MFQSNESQYRQFVLSGCHTKLLTSTIHLPPMYWLNPSISTVGWASHSSWISTKAFRLCNRRLLFAGGVQTGMCVCCTHCYLHKPQSSLPHPGNVCVLYPLLPAQAPIFSSPPRECVCAVPTVTCTSPNLLFPTQGMCVCCTHCYLHKPQSSLPHPGNVCVLYPLLPAQAPIFSSPPRECVCAVPTVTCTSPNLLFPTQGMCVCCTHCYLHKPQSSLPHPGNVCVLYPLLPAQAPVFSSPPRECVCCTHCYLHKPQSSLPHPGNVCVLYPLLPAQAPIFSSPPSSHLVPCGCCACVVLAWRAHCHPYRAPAPAWGPAWDGSPGPWGHACPCQGPACCPCSCCSSHPPCHPHRCRLPSFDLHTVAISINQTLCHFNQSINQTL